MNDPVQAKERTKENMRARGTLVLAFAAGLTTADIIIAAICLTPAWSLRGVLVPLGVVLVVAAIVATCGALMRLVGGRDGA